MIFQYSSIIRIAPISEKGPWPELSDYETPRTGTHCEHHSLPSRQANRRGSNANTESPDSIKLASNENPLGPSPKAMEAIQACMCNVNRYPDGSGFYLRRKLAQKFSIPFEGILLGNGSNEIIELVIRAFLGPGNEAVMPAPSFLLYKLVVQWMGGKAVPVGLKDFRIDLDEMLRAVTPHTRVIFLTNPNNPTGNVIGKQDFEGFVSQLPPGIVVVLDEAYH